MVAVSPRSFGSVPRFLNTISQQTTFYSAQDDEKGDACPHFFLRKGVVGR